MIDQEESEKIIIAQREHIEELEKEIADLKMSYYSSDDLNEYLQRGIQIGRRQVKQ